MVLSSDPDHGGGGYHSRLDFPNAARAAGARLAHQNLQRRELMDRLAHDTLLSGAVTARQPSRLYQHLAIQFGKGGAPPPPPPGGMPPPPPVLPEVDFSNMSLDDRSALFAEINQGENITSNLRKVTSDMQTHKNPQLRTGPAPFKAATRGAPLKQLPQPGAGTLPDKPPVFTRDGKKWLIVSTINSKFESNHSVQSLQVRLNLRWET
ncbi:hypothetical protein evm_014873 [Chilo suppressalis]|nr:hypothetical protein evm_014873 [Chilo suppressalis]